jgi:hypothetical protein
MKVTDSNQLPLNFKAGDIVWGCTYGYKENNGDGLAVNQLPVAGMLSPCRYEKDWENANNHAVPYINYFIPLKKDGKTPSWKKAIPVYALVYASTEDECNEMYNDAIQSNIEWHKSEIARLKKELIRVPKQKVVKTNTQPTTGNVSEN